MILDTTALSAFVDGDEGVAEVLRRQARAAIPVIVLGEFRYGISQSRHRPAYEAWLHRTFPIFITNLRELHEEVFTKGRRVEMVQAMRTAGKEAQTKGSLLLSKYMEES